MIPKGLFTQIGMVIISIAIIFTYIRPVFSNIGKIQEDISTYKIEREKVVEVNSMLSKLVTQKESLSVADRNRLFTYMPDTIDEISISRDLLLITLKSGVLYKDVAYTNNERSNSRRSGRDASPVQEDLPDIHNFKLSVQGTYDQIKSLFSLLEQNHYPLEVHGLTISKGEGGFLEVEMQIVTYSFKRELINDQVES